MCKTLGSLAVLVALIIPALACDSDPTATDSDLQITGIIEEVDLSHSSYVELLVDDVVGTTPFSRLKVRVKRDMPITLRKPDGTRAGWGTSTEHLTVGSSITAWISNDVIYTDPPTTVATKVEVVLSE